MAECGGCRTRLPDGARFCLECGRPVASSCGGCGVALPSEAKFCMECGTPRAAPAAASATPGLSGASSRRTTSILFADLVGFTTLSEALDAEDVRELLGRYFEECRRIIARYGGTIEKFIGDAVMAVWGVPTSHEDDAERAVRAGLELVTTVADFGRDVGAPDLALRVGVVTGEVAVTTGAEGQGMVAGDTVNTAARVQAAAAPGQVWVEETTRLLTTAAITYADAGSHPLKGKSDPVPLWSVRAVVAAVGGAQRADGLEAPLVGRDRELRLVKELFHQCQESRRPVLLVVDGEPGVGKTRLGWEFEKYVDGLHDIVRWHSGRCVAYGEGVAYFALAEAVRGRLQTFADPDAADETDVAELLRLALARHVPDEDERAWVGERLAVLLGLASVGTFPREDLFSAWTAFLQGVAEDKPLTLLIDDAQYADDGLLAFLEHLITVGTVPCFVLLLTRPGLLETHASLATHRRANVVHLPTLNDDDIGRLLDGLLAGLPGPVRDQLVVRAEGVPVFAVETVRSLIDHDLVVPRGGQYVLADPDSLDLDSVGAPASLQALIAARLDALTADQRLVVDRASVLGTTFDPAAVAELCPEVTDLPSVLRELVRLQILTQDASRLSAEFRQYRFVQSAVRQVAYGVLSRRDRRAVHLAVLAHMEQRGETGDDTAAFRAQHCLDALQAGGADDPALRQAALDNLLRAAARAQALSAPQEAVRHLSAAVPLASERAERARITVKLAKAEADCSTWDSAIDHARAAHRELVDLGDRVTAGLAVGVWALCVVAGRRNAEEALQLATPWWEELKDHDDALEAKLELSHAVMRAAVNSNRDVHDVTEARMALAEMSGDLRPLADCYNVLSIHYATQGATKLGNLLLEASAEAAREAHDVSGEALTLINLAAVHNSQDVAKALDLGQSALAVSRRTGQPFLIDIAATNYILACWSSGAWDRIDEVLAETEAATGVPLLDEAAQAVLALRALARGNDVPPLRPTALETGDDALDQAWAALHRFVELRADGDADEALTVGVGAVDLVFAVTGLWDDMTFIWAPVAEVAVDLGSPSAVARLVDVVDSRHVPMPVSLAGHRELVRGRLERRDDPGGEAADRALTAALGHYRAWGSPPAVARALAELSLVRRAQGRVEESEALLAEARTTYEGLGATPWLAELERVTAST